MSAQTFLATTSLSPVITFTSTPRRRSAAMASPASALGGSRKVRKPSSSRSSSSLSRQPGPPVGLAGGDRHDATPLRNRSAAPPAPAARPRATRHHGFRRSLDDHPSLAAVFLHEHRRQAALVVERPHIKARGYAARPIRSASGACHSARSSGLPPTALPSPITASLHTSPSRSTTARRVAPPGPAPPRS